jgi:hypothetical protein
MAYDANRANSAKIGCRYISAPWGVLCGRSKFRTIVMAMPTI